MASRKKTAKKVPKKVSAKSRVVKLPEVNHRTVAVTVCGRPGVPLIMNDFSAKTQAQMLAAQTGTSPGERKKKDLEECWRNSEIRDAKGRLCAKAIWFKCAMVAAAGGLQPRPKWANLLRQKLFVEGDLLPLTCEKIDKRQDWVRNSGQVADIRLRVSVVNWKTQLRIRYDADKIGLEQVLYLLRAGGLTGGVGEWRPSKCASGWAGLFDIEKAMEEAA